MSSNPGPKTVLSDAEEQVLMNCVTSSVKLAHPVGKILALRVANNVFE